MTRTLLMWVGTSCFLILAVLALRAVLGRKMSAGVRYALWGLVLARLLVPVQLFSLPFAGAVLNFDVSGGQDGYTASAAPTGERTDPGASDSSDFSDFSEPAPAIGNVQPDAASAAPAGGQEKTGTAVDPVGQGQTFPVISPPEAPSLPDAPDLPEAPSPAEAPAAPDLSGIPDWLGWVWLGGGIALALVLAVFNVSFFLRLCRTRRRLAGADCPAAVYAAPNLPSPCLFGLIRPAVYVTPAVAEDRAALRHVLAHEGTHYRHGDHVWSFLRCAALCLHWWNPLVWLAVELSRRDGELACDEGALKRLGDGERAAYGTTLLTLITSVPARAGLLTCGTTMAGDKRSLKERFTRIARAPRRLVSVAVAAALLAGLACACAFGQKEEEQEPADVSDLAAELTFSLLSYDHGYPYVRMDGTVGGTELPRGAFWYPDRVRGESRELSVVYPPFTDGIEVHIRAWWADEGHTSVTLSTYIAAALSSLSNVGYWEFTVDLDTGTVTAMDGLSFLEDLPDEETRFYPESISDEEAVQAARVAAKLLTEGEDYYNSVSDPEAKGYVLRALDKTLAAEDWTARFWIFPGSGPLTVDMNAVEYGESIRALFAALDWEPVGEAEAAEAENPESLPPGSYSVSLGGSMSLYGTERKTIWCRSGQDTIRIVTSLSEDETGIALFRADGAEALCDSLADLWPGPEVALGRVRVAPQEDRWETSKLYIAEAFRTLTKAGQITDFLQFAADTVDFTGGQGDPVPGYTFQSDFILMPAHPELSYWQERGVDPDTGWVSYQDLQVCLELDERDGQYGLSFWQYAPEQTSPAAPLCLPPADLSTLTALPYTADLNRNGVAETFLVGEYPDPYNPDFTVTAVGVWENGELLWSSSEWFLYDAAYCLCKMDGQDYILRYTEYASGGLGVLSCDLACLNGNARLLSKQKSATFYYSRDQYLNLPESDRSVYASNTAALLDEADGLLADSVLLLDRKGVFDGQNGTLHTDLSWLSCHAPGFAWEERQSKLENLTRFQTALLSAQPSTVPSGMAAQARSELREVLLGEADFTHYSSDARVRATTLSMPDALGLLGGSEYAMADSFAVVDLDGDGVEEAVVHITDVAGDMGGYLIFRWCGEGDVRCFSSYWRTFWNLKTDGTFDYDYYSGVCGSARVSFPEPGYRADQLSIREAQYNMDGSDPPNGTFTVNRKPASREEYHAAVEAQDAKPDAQWYEFTPENIGAALS